MKLKKNINIELLRIIAMFLIVACHGTLHISWLLNVDQQMTYPSGWKAAIEYLIVQYGQVGVSLFFIISGFFLIEKQFSFWRVFSTWFQMICYTTIILLVVYIAFRKMPIPQTFSSLFERPELYNTIIWTFLPFSYGSYWFITAYISMLFLMPYLNCIFKNMSKRNIELLIVILLLFGSWVLFFGRVSPWDNVTYAIVGYLIGGWIHKYYPASKKPLKSLIGFLFIILFSLLMASFNHFSASKSTLATLLGWNNQIKQGIQVLPILIASILFILVNQYNTDKLPDIAKKIVLYMAASTFGVYLLHENMFIYRIFWPSIIAVFPTPKNPTQLAYESGTIFIIAFIVLTLIAIVIDLSIVHPTRRFIANRLKRE